MEKHAFMAMVTKRMASALVPTAAAIPVAVLATCSYNFLRTRIDLRQCEVVGERQQRGRHFQGTRRFPPTKRFSELPAFGLIAASVPALVMAGYMRFASFHTRKGFYVELASAHCEYDVVDRHVVLHITGAGELFLNQEHQDWSTLVGRLSQIYNIRKYRTLYLLADSDVPFQTVAHALDTVEIVPVGSQAIGKRMCKGGIKVRLITPKVFNADCVVVPGADHQVLR